MRALRGLVIFLVSATSFAEPEANSPSTADVRQLAAVYGTTCALHVDGAVSCWGGNDHGQLGDPDRTLRLLPVDVPRFRGAVQLSGVGSSFCARFSSGSVTCTGGVSSMEHIVELRGDCAIDTERRAWCVADGVWREVPGGADAVAVDGTAALGCVVHQDATVSCWGRDSVGRSLVGGSADGTQRVSGVANVVEVVVGSAHACAREKTGHVTCWGSNADGGLGRGTRAELDEPMRAAKRVVGLSDAVRLQASIGATCAIRTTGTLVCWGQFHWIRGDGRTEVFPRPTAVGGLQALRDVASSDHLCALGKGRDVWCWGDGKHSALGLGYAEVLTSARDVPGISDAISVRALSLATCVLRKSGVVSCFGYQPPSPRLAPRLATLSSFRDSLTGLDRAGTLWMSGVSTTPAILATAHEGPCAVTKTGQVFCRARWMTRTRTGLVGNVSDAVEVRGESTICVRHHSGRVGCLSLSEALGGGDAVEVPSIHDAIALASSTQEQCAVRADHSVWCWGRSDSQFLGAAPDVGRANPTVVDPKPVADVSGVATISIGRDDIDPTETACAVSTDGRVTCWGVPNPVYRGVLPRSGAFEIPNLTDAVQVSVGWLHACAVRTSGAVACWGSTGHGQSGTLATDSVETPQRVTWPEPAGAH